MQLLNEEFVKHIDNLKILYDYLVRCSKEKLQISCLHIDNLVIQYTSKALKEISAKSLIFNYKLISFNCMAYKL